MIRILFTGAGRRIELIQAFRNAALVLNKELKIYGADMDGTAPALAYCDFSRKVAAMKDPNYIQNLLDICHADRIDLVIPTIDTDLLALSRNREKFEEIGTRVMISDPEMVAICRDKNNTSQFFVDCGLRAPMPVNNWKEYKSGFPAFIKPKDGSSSINAFKVESEAELRIYAADVETEIEALGSAGEELKASACKVKDYIIQPFVSGREYTIDIFCDWNGEPISIVPRERLQVRAGEVLKTRICMDSKMIGEAKKLCKAFKPRGAITIQLIRDDAGIDWFIEINPRFGGGSPLSMKAGARSAEYILKLLSGETPEYGGNIADGAVYCRFDQSVCVAEGKRNVKGVIFDLDDTLYAEKEYVKSGYRAVSEYLGGGYEDKLWEYFLCGKPAIDMLLKDLGREHEKADAVRIYRSHEPDIHLYSGAREMLEALRARGIKIGIITDGRSEGQRAKIRALGLENLADDIVITDELGGVQFRKPCDVAFRILQTRWRLNFCDMAYVADNPAKDFQAPQQLGMGCVLFKNDGGIYNDYAGVNANIAAVVQTISGINKIFG